ncbi:hypothetical protein DV736_g1699, partial [Chaetothyriales sp. CBS 134916]
MSAKPLTFADVIPITRLSSHEYQITLDEAWTIGTVPNGGYTTSAFLVCARTHMQLTHSTRSCADPINIHLEFIRRTAVGPATFSVRDVKIGSRISNLHLTLFQDYHNTGTAATRTPVRLGSAAGEDDNYMLRRKEAYPNFRRATLCMRMYLVKPDRRPASHPLSINDQWSRFSPLQREGRWTNDALGFVVDMFPQVVEKYINPIVERAAITEKDDEKLKQIVKEHAKNAKYWYPTMTLNLDVKKLLPEEGVEWLFTRTKAKTIKNGRLDLDIEVWDAQGQLIATSSHASLIVDTSRNTTRNGKNVRIGKL